MAKEEDRRPFEGGGAGSKLRTSRLGRRNNTPYERPQLGRHAPTAVRAATAATDNRGSDNTWFSRIVGPASRLITQGAVKWLSLVFKKNHPAPPSVGDVEIACQLFDEMPERDVKKFLNKQIRQDLASTTPRMGNSHGRSNLGSTRSPGKGSRFISDPFQIQISQPTGRTIMQWVRPSDLVQELKLNLERRMGIPSSFQRLLFQGKQLEDPLPLSSYSISRNSSVVVTLRLRGGAVGQSSSARPFSYKDAVHSENPKPPEALKSKAFLVDKIEEVPFAELAHEDLATQLQELAERAIICRFNGLWPRSQDLYAWIHANWTHHCKIFFCSKGYFIVLFDNSKHYEKALEEGPWFMGTAGLFMTPWFPDFDPATAVITKTPVWIRLPNLPAHLWNTRVFRAIGNTLGTFISGDLWRESKGLYSYARICVELDLSKGLPEQINLKINDFVWTQTLDYENTAFRCRHCHQSGHLQNTCPSRPAKKNKANVSKPKSK